MNKLKLFALYLPQFHETPENNEWWGEGYTDWVALKQAKPVFKGHKQPRVPLNKNYYDLTNVESIRWQASLAKEYSVNGFCIYHYYSNGKLMMNRPAEILLEDKSIDIEYFFSWGNHDFRKNWFNGDKSLLRKQEYGGQEDFLNHIEYLLPFFKDERYLKIDNKPVFTIYQVSAIENYTLMIQTWEAYLKKAGFDGIYIIAMKCQPGITNDSLFAYDAVKAVMPFEPLNVRSNASNGNILYIYKRRAKTVLLRAYNKLFEKHQIPEKFNYQWANQMIRKQKRDGKQYYCAFPDWDNTPRYQGKGVVFTGTSPELFGESLRGLIERSQAEAAEILFINAWNEWGETAYLEPDEINGYGNLEAVRKAVEAML